MNGSRPNEETSSFLPLRRFSRRYFGRTLVGTMVLSQLDLPNALLSNGGSQAIGAEPAHSATMGKEELRVLGDRPLNAETPAELLDDDITPTHRHFIRNNGLVPERAERQELTGWKLLIDGQVEQSLELTMNDLQSLFKPVTRALTIECAGNGRAGFRPETEGNQWTFGGVGCALYRGVRLRDVLEAARVRSSAVYIGYYGEDPPLTGDPSKPPISRGVPIKKALDPETLLAWEMNGEPLPAQHGFPLRLICPGWAGSTSGKWLKRIWVRDQIHDGAKMTGHAYRLPKNPIAPGAKIAEADMVIIEELPVKSLITFPASGAEIKCDRVELRGHAWSGHGAVKAVHISYDFGQSWIKTHLARPRNKYAWQRWHTESALPSPGHYEVWARATDEKGHMQPMTAPGWNPGGYLNNAMHRVVVEAV